MKRIAILGGGVSGLTAAYELEKARLAGAEIDWHLYESSDRLGGIIETTRFETPEGNYILEGGPDGWVTEKHWATELATELGLRNDLIFSNDATRKTYIVVNNKLQAIPDAMRLMVPTDLTALDASPLFSAEAKRAYAAEPTRAAELKATAPDTDESVASFVLRHFGEEVLNTLAAPLLSGVFGGDVHKLSVRAVMPQFVAMEREHGSLILALQSKSKSSQKPIFTSLRNGVGSLTDALIAKLPAECLHLGRSVLSLKRQGKQWLVRTTGFLGDDARTSKKHFHHILCALPADATRNFLAPLSLEATTLLPTDASSAVLAAFTFPTHFDLPQGFGFLVPPTENKSQLLACTFVDQKFPHRVPPNTRSLRAFFGGASADALTNATDAEITNVALTQLRILLGSIPDPEHAHIRRLPRSLPQYDVGHLDRMAQLDVLIANLPGLALLGNAYRGVGLPDLIRDARSAVRRILEAGSVN